MNDFQLQTYFQSKKITINGITRECYYCTLEDGGAWIWLHTSQEDRENEYRRINFVVYDKYKIEELYKEVMNETDIELTDYGYLSKQR